MMRAILGAIAGALLGAVLAVPVWWVITLADYAEIKRMDQARGVSPEEGAAVGDIVRSSQLLYLVVSTAGFGGTVGSVLGATSSILRAIKAGRPDLEGSD
jgi:hypothetical protein